MSSSSDVIVIGSGVFGLATALELAKQDRSVTVLDRAVLFGRSGELLDSASFDISGNGKLKILVCDLEPGDWTVRWNNESASGKISATPDSNCLYFDGEPGSYELRLISGGK